MKAEKKLTNLERFMECMTCKNDPLTCGCTDADEDGKRACKKYEKDATSNN